VTDALPCQYRLTLLVGSVAPELDLAWRIDHSGLGDAVVREDYVSEERLWSLIDRVDAVISLRSPTMGETSAMVVRALTLGKPVVVSDVGWFTELPDGVALKAAPDEREVDRLVAAMETLEQPGVREAMGCGRARARVE
jgi:glycosyltransferase involved in cell wall biosynthesis